MNHTSRMTALLGELRRERNGAVADAMRLVGAPYGLNYGVSLPTLRRLARAEKPDYAFAKFLSLQDVRELRLAAYHIADPAGLTPGEFPFWASGIVNHELAEEAAFALLPRIGDFPALFRTWTAAGMPWPLQYAALMAASRVVPPDSGWVDSAVEAVRRAAAAAETVPPDVAASEGGLVSAAPVAAVVAGTGPAASTSPESGFPRPQPLPPPASCALPPLRSLSHRGRWRCSRPSGPETGRAGRRCSAKPALWAGSVPKTTSTRSWPGGWKFSDVRRVRAVRSCRKPP